MRLCGTRYSYCKRVDSCLVSSPFSLERQDQVFG